jgi:hypothetical protein
MNGDDALPMFSALLLGLSVLDADDGPDGEGAATVERIIVGFPTELDVWTGAGRVIALGSSPPTQYTETTVMPVFHHLRLTLSINDERPA